MRHNYWQNFEYGCFYHIYNRSVAREPIFGKSRWVSNFKKRWDQLLSPYFDEVAYCFIPNHYHFMIRVKPEEDWSRDLIARESTRAANAFLTGEKDMNAFLEDQFRRLLSGFALSYNRKNKRQGAVFQEGFKRVMLSTEVRQWWQLCYIHHNPIHHGLVKHYKDWPYHSYHDWQVFDWERLPDYLQWIGPPGEKAKTNFEQAHIGFREGMNKDLSVDEDQEPVL